jgi:hypothetical protein
MPDADVLTNFKKAFYTRFTELTEGVHNSFYSAIGGRLYEGSAPDTAPKPYAVYFIVSAPKDKTFSEEYTDFSLQLSIFSENSSSAEISLAYHYAHTLYDEQPLTITGSTLVWMKEVNMYGPVKEEFTTVSGTEKVWALHIDFEAKTSLD